MNALRPRQAGMTLVELMVGMLIALIGMLFITGVLQSVASQKRGTVSNSDAQVIGGLAAYVIERDLRRAGFGLNSEPALGCSLRLADAANAPSPLPLNPITITPGDSDSLTIVYAQARHGWYSATLSSDYVADNAPFAVDNPFGFTNNDLIMVGPATTTEADGRPICGMYQVSAVTASTLAHAASGTNSAAVNGLRFNRGARIYSLDSSINGDAAQPPEQVIYAISANNELTMTSRATNFQPVAIGEQMVMLRAQYCKDTVNATPSTITQCDQVAPTTAAGWRQVLSVRFAVVARSASREGSSISADTLQLFPQLTLPNGVTLDEVTLPLGDEARHYRYRVFGSVVPLRNMLWQVPNS